MPSIPPVGKVFLGKDVVSSLHSLLKKTDSLEAPSVGIGSKYAPGAQAEF